MWAVGLQILSTLIMILNICQYLISNNRTKLAVEFFTLAAGMQLKTLLDFNLLG